MTTQRHAILAAVTFDELADRILEHALQLAREDASIEVHVVYVVEPAIDPQTGTFLAESAEQATTRLGSFVGAAVERTLEEHGTIDVRQVFAHVIHGPASTAICELAARLDVEQIVIGTHGRRGVSRWFLGSVAEEVVRKAGCPVLVVRAKQHPPIEKEPQIEAVCPDCAAKRYETGEPGAWCAMHQEHHPRAHVYSYTPISTDPARPWGFHG